MNTLTMLGEALTDVVADRAVQAPALVVPEDHAGRLFLGVEEIELAPKRR